MKTNLIRNLFFQLQTFSRLDNNLQYSNFLEIYQCLLNKYAPIKKNVVRANEAPFMTNELRKAIMIRSRLKNILNLHPSEENKEKFRKQRNCCNSLKRNKIFITILVIMQLAIVKHFGPQLGLYLLIK